LVFIYIRGSLLRTSSHKTKLLQDALFLTPENKALSTERFKKSKIYDFHANIKNEKYLFGAKHIGLTYLEEICLERIRIPLSPSFKSILKTSINATAHLLAEA
jgi:hypothetical protein